MKVALIQTSHAPKVCEGRNGAMWRLLSIGYSVLDKPSLLREQGDDPENKEHEKHPRVLKVIRVRWVQDPIHKELETSWIQKLYAHINKSSDCQHIKLQVSKPSIKTRHWVQNPNLKLLWVHHKSHYCAAYVPQRNWRENIFIKHKSLAKSGNESMCFSFSSLSCLSTILSVTGALFFSTWSKPSYLMWFPGEPNSNSGWYYDCQGTVRTWSWVGSMSP